MGPAFTIHVAFDASGFLSGAAQVEASAEEAGASLDELSGRFAQFAQSVNRAMAQAVEALQPVLESFGEISAVVTVSTEESVASLETLVVGIELVGEAAAEMGAGVELLVEAQATLVASSELAAAALLAQGAAAELAAEAMLAVAAATAAGATGGGAGAAAGSEVMAEMAAAAELAAEAQVAVAAAAELVAEALAAEGAAAELVVEALVAKGAAAELAAAAQVELGAASELVAVALGTEAGVAAAVAAALGAAAAANAAAAAAATAAAAASSAAMAALAAATKSAAGSVAADTSIIGAAFGALRASLSNLMVVFGAAWVFTGLVDANLEIMRVRQSLEYATGSLQGMQDSWNFLEGVTDRLGTNLRSSATNFGLLTAAAKGTTLEGQRTRDVFVALSEAGTVLDLSADKMQRAMYVVQNMISKGTVSAVELRRELGTAIPGAMELAAKTIQQPGEALETAMQRFNQQMKAGLIQAGTFLPAFAKQLHDAFGPDVATAAQNSLSQINRFKNALFEVEGVVSDQFMPALASMSKLLAEAGRSADFQAFAHDMGQAIGGIIEGLSALGQYLVEHGIRWRTLRSVIAETTADVLNIVADMVSGVAKMLSSILDFFSQMSARLAQAIKDHPIIFAGQQEAADQFRDLAKDFDTASKDIASGSKDAQESLHELADGYKDVAEEQLELQAKSDAADAALKKLVDTTFQGVPGVDGLTQKVDKLVKKFDDMRAALRSHIADQQQVAAAYAQSVQAGDQMEKELAAQERAMSKAKDMTGAMKTAVLALATAAEKWDATVSGSKDLAGLERQQADLQKINAAYGQGVVAVAQANRNLEAETLLRENLSKVTADQTDKLKELIAQMLDDQATKKFLDAAAAIQEENDGLLKLNDAYAKGHNAVLQAKDDVDLETKLRKGLGDMLGVQRDRMAALIIVNDTLANDNSAKQQLQDLKDQVDVETQLAAVHNLDYDTQRKYQQAVAAVNDTLELKDKIRALGAGASKQEIADLTALILKERQLKTEIQGESDARKKRQDAIKEWGDLADTMANAFAGMDAGIAKLITSAKGLADAWEKVATAETTAQRVGGGASLGSAIGGLLQTGGPAGGVGGAGEGNQAQVGGAIGGAIGAFFGGVGAIVGSVLGTIVGSAIKKGGDEALGTISFISDELTTAVTESEHGLGMIISNLGDALKSGLDKIVADLGGVINSLPNIDVKIRDGTIRLVVGTVTGYFTDVQSAIQFAIEQELKQGNISGLSDEIKTVLKNTTATTLDDLASDLDFGKWVQQLNLPDITIALQNLGQTFLQDKHRADDLGLSTQKLTQWYAAQLAAQKNQVLGITVDPAVQLRQNVAAFNAEVALERADAQQKVLDLESKRDYLEGQMQYVQATGHLYEAELGVQEGFLGASLAIAQTGGNVLATLGDSLAAVNKSIDDELAILKALPDAISDKELQDALNRLKQAGAGKGGTSATDKQSQIDSFNSDVAAMLDDGMDPFGKSLEDLASKLAKLTDTAKKLGLSEDQVAAARQHEIDVLKKQLTDQLIPYLPQSAGGQSDMPDFQKGLADLHAKFATIEQENQALLTQTGQKATTVGKIRLAELEAERQLVESTIAGLNLPMEQTAAQGKQVADAMFALITGFNDGAISGQRYQQVLKEIQQQSATTLYSMAENLFTAEGDTKDAAAMKAALDKANFELQLAQMNVLYNTLLAAGAIAPDVAAAVKKALDYLNDPAHQPDFTPVDPGIAKGIQDQQAAAQEIAQWQQDQAQKRADLMTTLDGYLQSGWDPLVKQLYDLNNTFVDLRTNAFSLGVSMAQVDAAYQAAVKDFWAKALAPLQQAQQDLLKGADSPLTAGEKFQLQQQEYNTDLAKLHAGDLSVLSDLPQVIKDYIDDAKAVLPTASAAYVSLFNDVQTQINALLASGGVQGADLSQLYALLGQTAPPGAPGIGSGAGAPGAPDIIAATQAGSSDVVNELRANALAEQDWLRQIAQHTNDAQTGIYQVYNRLNLPLIVSTR